jgi:hypothetical protein
MEFEVSAPSDLDLATAYQRPGEAVLAELGSDGVRAVAAYTGGPADGGA